MQRRLAAILVADVAGFSRLMAADERGTYERLKALRLSVVDPAIAEHGGRIVKLMGDGMLAEFGSAVHAVDCAAAIQRGMAAANQELPTDRQIRVRIGINLGEIMIDDRDIYGDGVNIAARIQALAEPGGIAISDDVYRHIKGKTETPFEDLGERPLKHLPAPVRIHHTPRRCFAPAEGPIGEGWPATPTSRPPPPDQPSIVVLPFDHMSGDPDQTYFSDGISEDIITDLSKISGLFIIARNSAFTYRGRAVDLTQVCRELGVRYALEGSVRKAGNRVRITAQLIDGATGGHLWAERYDRELIDIFAVQDEVTREIVTALKVQLTPLERRRLAARGTADIEAYDNFLEGREYVRLHCREGLVAAVPLFERAMTIDPGFALPRAFLGLTRAVQYVNRWVEDPEEALAQGHALAEEALRLDDADAQVRFALGVVHLWRKQVDEAIAGAERAIALDPNYAEGYVLLGNALHYAGRSEESLPAYERMAQLDPYHPAMYLHFVAQSQFALGRYGEAAAFLRRRLIRQPDSDVSRILLAACYGHLGQPEKAKAEWREALRVSPDYSLEHRRAILPYKNPADFDRLIEGLSKAGVPV